MGDSAVGPAEQDVGDAGALRARQPGGDEGVRRVDLRVRPQRAPGQEDRDDRDVGGPKPAHQLQVGLVRRAVLDAREVALAFGVGRLAGHVDGRVRQSSAVGAALAEDGLAARRLDGPPDAGPDGRGAGEVVVRVARALPGQGPAAALPADVVGRRPGDEHERVAGEGQDAVVVLQQHERLAHRLAGHFAMFGIAQQLESSAERPFGRRAAVEQAGADLHPQDAPHRVVEPRLGNPAGPRLPERAPVERSPVLRHHEQVEPGANRVGAVVVAAAGQLAVAVPVADDEPVEGHPALQHVRQEPGVAVQLLAAPTAERGHDRLGAGVERGDVGRVVDVAELLLARPRVSLIRALEGAAVSQEVLGRGDHPLLAQEVRAADRALKAFDQRARVLDDDLGILRVALVRAAPAVVAGDGDGRPEVPVEAGDADLARRDLADAAHQVRVPGRAEPDVVGEDRRPHHVVVAVYRVHAPDRGNADPAVRRVGRGFVERVGQRQPAFRRGVLVVAGERAAAVQHRAQVVPPHVPRRDGADFRLNDLAHLFAEGHPLEQRVHARFELRVGRQRRRQFGPEVGVDLGTRSLLRLRWNRKGDCQRKRKPRSRHDVESSVPAAGSRTTA